MNQRVCPNSGKELAVDEQVLYTMIAMYVDDWTIQTFPTSENVVSIR